MEKPILFNTEMVKAILEGRKTQTRRVVKNKAFKEWVEAGFTDGFIKSPENNWTNVCPYQPGDILWVRETWCYGSDTIPIMFDPEPMPGNIIYKADFSYIPDKEILRWRPLIHMPREAARIFLKVTDVRAERLQDITEEEARKEGVSLLSHDGKSIYTEDYRAAFRVMWDDIYKNWSSNPWVWVIEFERLRNK